MQIDVSNYAVANLNPQDCGGSSLLSKPDFLVHSTLHAAIYQFPGLKTEPNWCTASILPTAFEGIRVQHASESKTWQEVWVHHVKPNAGKAIRWLPILIRQKAIICAVSASVPGTSHQAGASFAAACAYLGCIVVWKLQVIQHGLQAGVTICPGSSLPKASSDRCGSGAGVS